MEPDEEQEEIKTDDRVHNKFSISPVIAAVYYGNFGDGNALDNKLADNLKSGEIQTPYGISVGYQVSQRLKVCSGFNNSSLNSNTQNVENSIALNAKAIDLDPAASFGIPEGIGNLNQHLVFLEIPLEVEHALVNKRFGINIITGASTFFLKENKTTLISSGFSHLLVRPII